MMFSPDIFRPPTNPNTRSKKMREWFESSPADKIDILQPDPKVTGLLCFNDGLFTTLEGLKIIRTVNKTKDIVGAVRKHSSFQLFSVPADVATSNFFSYLPFDDDGYIPYEIKVGELLPDILEKLKGADQVAVKEMFQKDALKGAIGLIYLPLVLPLTKTDYIPEGGLGDVATLEAIASLHPLAKCWVSALAKDLLLVEGKVNTSILQRKASFPKWSMTWMQLLLQTPL